MFVPTAATTAITVITLFVSVTGFLFFTFDLITRFLHAIDVFFLLVTFTSTFFLTVIISIRLAHFKTQNKNGLKRKFI